MKKLILLALFLLPVSAFAETLPSINYAGMFFQTSKALPAVRKVSALPATCTAVGSASSSSPVLYRGRIYACTATNTWGYLATGDSSGNLSATSLTTQGAATNGVIVKGSTQLEGSRISFQRASGFEMFALKWHDPTLANTAFVFDNVNGNDTEFRIAGVTKFMLTGSNNRIRALSAFVTANVASTAGAGATATLDLATGNIFTVTFGAGDITNLTATNVPTSTIAQTIKIFLIQDAAGGSRTANWDNTIFKFTAATEPTLTTAVNSVDSFTFTCASGICRLDSAVLDLR